MKRIVALRDADKWQIEMASSPRKLNKGTYGVLP